MTQHPTGPPRRPFLRHLRNRLTAGLLLLVPLLITYWVLKLAFTSLDGVFRPLIRHTTGWDIPGLGIVIILIMVYLAGLFASNYLGRAIIKAGQSTLLRVPLISTIYDTFKQLIESFSGTAQTGFKRVVAIEYPRPGVWAVGFLTGTTQDESGKTMGIVYIPTAPTPNTGWVAMLPMEEIRDTNITVREAMLMTVSAGIVSPAQIKKLPPRASQEPGLPLAPDAGNPATGGGPAREGQ